MHAADRHRWYTQYKYIAVQSKKVYYDHQMNEYHLSWLKEELPVLVKKQLLPQECADNITAYYDAQVQAEKLACQQRLDARKTAAARRLPVMLSIIAAVLIAGGIISLIAYNWGAISRTVKTAAAFVLLCSTQAAGIFFCLSDRTRNARLRECIALLWALLFGAVVAFVSQIYRFPSNAAGFTLVWAASSILLTYAFNSYSTFILSLIQTAVYLAAGWNSSLIPVYILQCALIPFVLRKSAGHRLQYIMLIYSALLLVPMLLRLETTVPMFVLYTSLASLFIHAGRKPLKNIGFTALIVLAVILTVSTYTTADMTATDAGVLNRRQADRQLFSALSAEHILTLIFTGILFFISTALPLYLRHIKKTPLQTAALSAAAAAVNLLVLCRIIPGLPADAYLAVSRLLFFVIPLMLAALFILYALKERRPYAWIIFIQLVFFFIYTRSGIAALAALAVFACGIFCCREFMLLHMEKHTVVQAMRTAAAVILFTAAANPAGCIAGIYSVPFMPITSAVMFLTGIAGFFYTLAVRRNRGILSAADILVTLTVIFAVGYIPQHAWPESAAACITVLLHAITIAGAALGALLLIATGKQTYIVYVPAAAGQFIRIAVTGSWESALPVITLAAAMHLYARTAGGRFRKPAGIIAAAAAGALLLFHTALGSDSNSFIFDNAGIGFGTIPAGLYLLFFFLLNVSFCAKLLYRKHIFNYALVLYYLLIIATVRQPVPESIQNSIPLPVTALFCLYYFYRAYKLHSAAAANCTALYAGIVLMLRFFILGYGLVTQGITLILLGIFILAVNRILSRKEK